MTEMEKNTRGNNMVIIGAYIPHDDVQEAKRIEVWEKLGDRIQEISSNKNVIVCGDFNASLHARKEGEEQHIGPHTFCKRPVFLANKEPLETEPQTKQL